MAHIKQRGGQALLWEDHLSSDLWRELHAAVKTFCHTWYKGTNNQDQSLYDGVSLGQAMSYLMYQDIESWVRVFYFFEDLAKKKIHTYFYVPRHDYFPDILYDYIKKLESAYNTQITIIPLGLQDHRIEFSVRYVLSLNRNKAILKKTRYFKWLKHFWSLKHLLFQKNSGREKWLLLNIRNTQEYLIAFANKKLYDKAILCFDAHYIGARALVKNLFKRGVNVVWDTVPEKKPGPAVDTQIIYVMDSACDGLAFLGDCGRAYFKDICRAYIPGAIHMQIRKYEYFKILIEKNDIQLTVTAGHDSPESYYVSHLMRTKKRKSFFLPHGLVYKDKATFPDRENLADHIFSYSQAEAERWQSVYHVKPERLAHTWCFRQRVQKTHHVKRTDELKIMLLLDNFQVSLASKINIWASFYEVYKLLIDAGFRHIVVRLHPTFYNYHTNRTITPVERQAFFHSAPIQNPFINPLQTSIGRFDLVIGPLTTCVYEAIFSGVLFIPYIPDFFPEKETKQIVSAQWLPGLFPSPCVNAKDLTQMLDEFKNNQTEFYKEFTASIDRAGVHDSQGTNSPWDPIIQGHE